MPKSRSRSSSKSRKHSRRHSRTGSRSRRSHSRRSHSRRHNRKHSRSGSLDTRIASLKDLSTRYSPPFYLKRPPSPTYSELAKEKAEKLSKHGKELAKWLLKEMEKHQKLFAYVSAASLLVAVTALGIRAAWPRIKAKYEQIRAKHSHAAKSKSRSKRRRRSHSRSGSSAASAVRGKAKEVHKYANEMADWLIGEIKKNQKMFAAVSVASLAVVATALGIRKAWPRIKSKLEEIREKIRARGSEPTMDRSTV